MLNFPDPFPGWCLIAHPPRQPRQPSDGVLTLPSASRQKMPRNHPAASRATGQARSLGVIKLDPSVLTPRPLAVRIDRVLDDLPVLVFADEPRLSRSHGLRQNLVGIGHRDEVVEPVG